MMTMSYRWAIPILMGTHCAVTWWSAVRRGALARQAIRATPTPPEAIAEPFVSVLIPAWNEAGTIESCLSSLEQVSYRNLEVVVIAGGDDGTFEAVRGWSSSRHPSTVVRQPPGGKNAALTLGLSVAKGDVIVILDADSIVEPYWLRRLILPITEGGHAVCGDFHPKRWTWVSAYEQMQKIAANHVQAASALQGSGSIAVTRDALDVVGGFPPSVKVGVDWDLGIRLQRAGLRLSFAPGADLLTDRPATIAEHWKNEVRWRRAHLASLWEHRRWFFHDMATAIQSSAFAIMTMITICVVTAPVVVVLRSPSAARQLLLFAVMFLGWLAVRRAALAGTIAAFTGERHWLGLMWAAPVLTFVSMLANARAATTIWRRVEHFKGPRHVVPAEGSRPDTRVLASSESVDEVGRR